MCIYLKRIIYEADNNLIHLKYFRMRSASIIDKDGSKPTALLLDVQCIIMRAKCVLVRRRNSSNYTFII